MTPTTAMVSFRFVWLELIPSYDWLNSKSHFPFGSETLHSTLGIINNSHVVTVKV